MRKFIFASVIMILLLATSIGQGTDPEPALQRPQLSADYAKQRDRVLPSPSEQSYRKIAWRGSVLHGIVEAQKKDRPVMIVLMNGHPLGCT
jgi:hypothetical protein